MRRPSYFKDPNLRRRVQETDGDDHDPNGTIDAERRCGPLQSSQPMPVDPAFTGGPGRRGLDLDDHPFVSSIIRGDDVDFHTGDPAVPSHDAKVVFDEMCGCETLSKSADLSGGRSAAVRENLEVASRGP